jgi:hypothetical protein
MSETQTTSSPPLELQLWRFLQASFYINGLFLLLWTALVITDHLEMSPPLVSLRCWLIPPFLIHSTALGLLFVWQYKMARGLIPHPRFRRSVFSLTLLGIVLSTLLIGALTSVVPPESPVSPSDSDGPESLSPPST